MLRRMSRRLNVRLVLTCALAGLFCGSFTFWASCPRVRSGAPDPDMVDEDGEDPPVKTARDIKGNQVHVEGDCKNLPCIINGEDSIMCRASEDEVFVPFTFLSQYFEVEGKLRGGETDPHFEWIHAPKKGLYEPQEPYDPKGAFGWFSNYNVEVRDRVKCISALHDVPVSTQWSSSGYLYPIQIAQYALSHFSKNLTDPGPRITVVADSDQVIGQWKISPNSFVQRIYDKQLSTNIVEFHVSKEGGMELHLPGKPAELVLGMDLNLEGEGKITVAVKDEDGPEVFQLHYETSRDLLTVESEKEGIVYGLRIGSGWRRFVRDLFFDLQKGLAVMEGKRRKRMTRSRLTPLSISFVGKGHVDNVTLSTTDHVTLFFQGADWFVSSQDQDSGGWPVPVERRLAQRQLILKPGWHSAMAQGQALSVLARAFHASKNEKYLDAALKGVNPFRVNSSDGGVRTYFLDKFVFYEEYPTVPSSFVLNGFIYSLLGLFDLASILGPTHPSHESVNHLYQEGLTSLLALLPLYDTGSGSVYDLRHFTLGGGPPPNLARWDYHVTHINQLRLLATIEEHPILSSTAERWFSYMNGHRAPHN